MKPRWLDHACAAAIDVAECVLLLVVLSPILFVLLLCRIVEYFIGIREDEA